MIATEHNSFLMGDNQRGASILEILLVIAIISLVSPFLYNQISETSKEINNITTAKRIMATRDAALNFVRLNQDKWPEVAQIKLSPEELATVTDKAHAAFIDKYQIKGATVTDIYLAFSGHDDKLRTTKIATQIGADNAATVDTDGVAYGASWAVTAPDFEPGDLIYRINYDFDNEDTTRYLHRGTSGEDDLNVMYRNLNMGKSNIYNIATISSETAKFDEASAAFTETGDAAAVSVYFAAGANLDGNVAKFSDVRANGDITGFRNIYASKLNRAGFGTNGTVISDRAKITNSIQVGKNMNIKSDTARTISGFAGIVTHSLATTFVSADEMIFYNDFGLTVSGELLMSTDVPLRIGSWVFPSSNAPTFSIFELSRAPVPEMPGNKEFEIIMNSGWRDAVAKE